MAGYGRLLRTPGVARIIAAQLAARFPAGMTSLALLMHVEHMTGSYGAAGLVLAAEAVGQAVSGPVTSRWMGRFGARLVLTVTMLVCAASLAVIAVVPAPVPVFVGLGLVSGLSTPPVQSAVRTIYPTMVDSRQLTVLFSLDASLQEIIWILAPVLITFVVGQAGTTVGLLMICGILIAGGVWFICSPELGRVRIPRSRHGLGRVLTRPAVLMATVMGVLIVGSNAAVDPGVIAMFGQGGVEAGIVLAVFSVGSLMGGLLAGGLPMGRWAMARRMAVTTAGLAVTVVSVNVWWVGGSLMAAGLGVAPSIAVMYAMTTASVSFSDTAEAFGWITTGQLVGAAAGSAVAGFAIDGMGPAGAYVSAAGFAAVGMLAAIVFVRVFPDLRLRGAAPLPDTAAISTVGDEAAASAGDTPEAGDVSAEKGTDIADTR